MAAAQEKLTPIGFQLNSVRGEFARNVPATLKTLRQSGCEAVEFWGYGGAPNFHQGCSGFDRRKLLDDCGLKCWRTHIDLKTLEELRRLGK